MLYRADARRPALKPPHHERTRSDGKQRGTTVKGAKAEEAAALRFPPGQRPDRPQNAAASQADGMGQGASKGAWEPR